MSDLGGLDWRMGEILNGGLVPTRRRAGNVMCLCPAHADRGPSLAVRWKNGTMVYKCYARCSWDEIWRAIRAMGYDPVTTEQTRSDVRPPVIRPEGRNGVEAERRFREFYRYAPYDDPKWHLDERAHPLHEGRAATARYVYRDGTGHPMMLVHRYDWQDAAGKAHKLFLPTTPWYNMAKGRIDFPDRSAPEPRTPYGNETFRRAGPVIFTEGEKCRDAVDRLFGGAVAVGSVYGSDPKMTDTSMVADRTMVIVRDLDVPGEIYAERLAEQHGANWVVVTPPHGDRGPEAAPEGWDVADDIEGKGVPAMDADAFVAHLGRQALAMDPAKGDVLLGALRGIQAARARLVGHAPIAAFAGA